MKIGFLGAGKVGLSFGLYLQKNNFEITGYFSRSHLSAQSAAKITKTCAFEKIEDLANFSDGIFITTNDDQIESACLHLVSLMKTLRGKFVVHMSGALSSKILDSAVEKGAVVFSLHPLQSFAEVKKSVKDLENTYFGIEGEKQLEILEKMLKQTGNPYLTLQPEHKKRYHIAACTVSNYLVALIDNGLELLGSIGIEKEEGLKALLPMIMGTVKNIDKMGTEAALTGPIARGDIQTIQKQMEVFGKEEKKLADTYGFLGLLTLNLASKSEILDNRKIEKLTQILNHH